MNLYELMVVVAMVAGTAMFAVCMAIFVKKPVELENVFPFFLCWSLVWLFDYYFLGSSSFVYMDDEADSFVSFYKYLSDYHIGGQFGHGFSGGNDVYSTFSAGSQIVSVDRLLVSLLPVWIGILVHKSVVVSVGFVGTYLLCRRGIGSDKAVAGYLAAFFTVSNHLILYISFGPGAALAFMPLVIYVCVVRAKEATYYPYVLAVSVFLSPFVTPTHGYLPTVASIIFAAVLFGQMRGRVILSVVVISLAIAVNWAEVMFAMIMISPYTARGGEVANSVASTDFVDTLLVGAWKIFWSKIWIGYVGLVAMVALIALKDPHRWRATVAYLGPIALFVAMKVFPWKSVGLGFFSHVSHWYVLIAEIPLAILLIGRVELALARAPRLINASLDRLPASAILALAVGVLVYSKTFQVGFLIYQGGQSHFHTIDTLKQENWRPEPHYRALTLRVRDLGPEPGVVGGFYGLETFDSFANLLPKPYVDFWRQGILGPSASAYTRLWVDWSKWNGQVYDFESQVSIDPLRVANVGYVLSPLPMAGENLELEIGPDRPPLTRPVSLDGVWPYAIERVRRLFDLNDLYVYRIKGALPQVYAATGVVRSSDMLADDALIELISRHGPSRRVVVSDSLADELGPASASLRVLDFQQIRNGYAISVDAPDGGILIVNTSWLPFWRAEADGDELRIVPANMIQMAVFLPPGTQNVNFRYHRPTVADALASIW